MKRVEVHIAEGEANRRLGTLEYFRLSTAEANVQLSRIRSAVARWRAVAVHLGIPRREQEEMSACFAKS
jgi:hypothetical protein